MSRIAGFEEFHDRCIQILCFLRSCSISLHYPVIKRDIKADERVMLLG